jgi:hypothetical protein
VTVVPVFIDNVTGSKAKLAIETLASPDWLGGGVVVDVETDVPLHAVRRIPISRIKDNFVFIFTLLGRLDEHMFPHPNYYNIYILNLN